MNTSLFHLTCLSVFTVDDNNKVLEQGVFIKSCSGWSLCRIVFWHLWQTRLHFQDLHMPGLWRCLTSFQRGVILPCSSATTRLILNLVCAVLSSNPPPLIHFKNEIKKHCFTWRITLHLSLISPANVSCRSSPKMCFAVVRNSFSFKTMNVCQCADLPQTAQKNCIEMIYM